MKLESEILKGYLSMKDILSIYADIDKWKLHYLLRMRKYNGLDDILIKIGLKFYVNKEDFDNWKNMRGDHE